MQSAVGAREKEEGREGGGGRRIDVDGCSTCTGDAES